MMAPIFAVEFVALLQSFVAYLNQNNDKVNSLVIDVAVDGACALPRSNGYIGKLTEVAK